MMVFSLTSTAYEEDESPGSQQLFQLLQINRGDLRYPHYDVHRLTRVHQSREALIEFQEALQMDGEILAALEKKAHEKGLTVYERALAKYEEYVANDTLIKWVEIYRVSAV